MLDPEWIKKYVPYLGQCRKANAKAIAIIDKYVRNNIDKCIDSDKYSIIYSTRRVAWKISCSFAILVKENKEVLNEGISEYTLKKVFSVHIHIYVYAHTMLLKGKQIYLLLILEQNKTSIFNSQCFIFLFVTPKWKFYLLHTKYLQTYTIITKKELICCFKIISTYINSCRASVCMYICR